MSATLIYVISYSFSNTTYCNKFYIAGRCTHMFKAFEDRTGLQYRSVEEQTMG